jgi:HEPN domain-containing protein
MPVDVKDAGSPQDWLRHARSDLALCGMLKTRRILYQHLCFHAQQAGEKALKAVLVANGVRFPKTHDLAFLMQLLPSAVSVPPPLINLPVLNQYAVQQRYPGEVPRISCRDYKAAAVLAEVAVSWAARCVARTCQQSA